MRFLVVDDSATISQVTIKNLREIGYNDIVEAAHGGEAYSKLQKGDIDFIITDWNMPNVNGLQLVTLVRTNPHLKNLPILMATTRGRKEDVIEAVRAKINSYIVKPFTAELLKSKIDEVIVSIIKNR